MESLQKVPQKVIQSGNRDDAPTKEVLKNIAWSERKASRADPNELISLQKIIQQYQDTEKDVLQKILMHPKGVMLWSKKTWSVFHQRCKEDIVYFDATGSIIR